MVREILGLSILSWVFLMHWKGWGFGADKADKSRNIAAVMVTADIGPFAKEGSRMDVTVSSIGNADSLQGGVLLQTPMFGADGTVYSVAQGPVSIGGLSAGNAGGANVQVNHPTVGIVSNGALVEREIESQVLQGDSLDLILRAPDSTTAVKLLMRSTSTIHLLRLRQILVLST